MTMKCKLITETIGGRAFIGGYYSDPSGIELPDKIENTEWRDAYGNYNWELLSDGSIVASDLVPSADQLAKKQDDERIGRITVQFLKIVKQAILNTAGPAESWKAIDAALRAIL
jgi:hypothetical protein